MRTKTWYLLGLLAMLLLPLLVKLPAYSPTWQALNDTAHSVLFLLLCIGFAAFYKLPGQHIITTRSWQLLWAALLSGGVGIEVLQSFIGRSASVYDVFLDSIGIGVGSLLYCAWQQKRASLAAIACALMMFAFINPLWVSYHSHLLHKQLPIVCNFDGPCPWALGFNQGRFKTLKPHMPKNSLWPNNNSEFGLLNYPAAPYPGIGIQNAFASWAGYKELCAELYWPYLFDSQIGIHIHDANFPHKSDKFDSTAALKPGANTVCISLEVVAKNVDLTAAKTLIYYKPAPKDAGELYLDNIRLR
ncbi:VanZ family protein [Marinagarivorans cellulosilyticus]|nr:VanZ family protein [Marinagarivorans cellulosilyticus]